jgi:hypothetical protein
MEQRKLVIMVFEDGLRPDMEEVLVEQGIEHYTLWSGAEGSGVTGTKQGTPIWPGLNEVMLIALPQEKVQPLIRRATEVRDSFPVKLGLRFMVTDCLFA